MIQLLDGTKKLNFVVSCLFTCLHLHRALLSCVTNVQSLCASESGCVKFSFLKHSEFLRVGARVLLQEGVTRAIGEITQLVPIGEERTRCSR